MNNVNWVGSNTNFKFGTLISSVLLLLFFFNSYQSRATDIDLEKKRMIQAHFLIKMGAFIKWEQTKSLPLVLCINNDSDGALARTLSRVIRKHKNSRATVSVRAFEFDPKANGKNFQRCNIIYNFSLSSLLESKNREDESSSYLHSSQSVWITSSANKLQEGAHFALVERKGKMRLLGNQVLLEKPSLNISTQLMQIVKFESVGIQN